MTSPAWLRDPRVVKLALVAVAVAFAVTHVIATLTESLNWDELALLHRAQHALITGELQGGGRPGLGTLPLIALVDGCDDHVALTRTMRVVWTVSTFALLAGLFVFLRRATRRSPHAWHAAALGTAALALVPLFLRWSLQVRTDQPALAAALWGGVALLASRDRRAFAAIAGALFGLGYLFSQKAVYIGGLVSVVALGELYIERTWVWRRELVRALGVVVGAVVVIALFTVVAAWGFSSPRVMSVGEGMDLFTWYRFVLRYRLYGAMSSSVIPQLALLALVFVAALRAFRHDGEERRSLLVALVVLVMGVAVGRFHTASFPYFWMTIGLFPATAIAIGWPGIRAMLPRAHVAVAAAAWIAMLALAIRFRVETLADTQAPQRETLRFVDRQLPRSWRGFHPDGALVCRRDPTPFPVYLGQHITSRFGGVRGEANQTAFIAEHAARPVSFIVRTPRMASFPTRILKFWETHYVPYGGNVEVAGRRYAGAAATRDELDVIVPGTYRWWSAPGTPARISVDGRPLDHGETIELAAGRRQVVLIDAVDGGTLALALDLPPAPGVRPFYDPMTLAELSSVRRSWW